MSADDYGASVNGCIGRTQISRSAFSSTSYVSESDIREWLDEQAADVDGFVGSVLGQSVGSLSTKAKSQFKRYIEEKAAVAILRRLGSDPGRIDDLEASADAIMVRFEATPERIDGTKANDVFTTSPSSRTNSTRTPDTFIGDNYDGF